MFYTRIPIPKSIGYSSGRLNKATKYLPLVGIVVGSFGALIFWSVHQLLAQDVAIITALSLMVLLTGAFHEDAFADFCDGFGGGYTKEKILSIMKDSQIGTYGAVGLSLLILIKFILLSNASAASIPILFIAAHSFSRLMPVGLLLSLHYVSHSETSKSKAITEKKNICIPIIAILITLIPLYFINLEVISLIILVQILLFLYFRYYIHKKINGYTGDTLGALQQISEVVFYFSFLLFTAILC